MVCPQCNATAPEGAKFCLQCGSRLGVHCPSCGHANPPDSKFCGQCGSALNRSKARPGQKQGVVNGAAALDPTTQGERRHLTILFTDVTGYTRMMEDFDPEDVQSLMATVMRSSVKIIESYNGHIERIIGDGILAIFGLPVAHEDDAIRAIKAVREIHRTVRGIKPKTVDLKHPLAMHSGINTGLAVTARTVPLDGTYNLSGEAVNLASRLSDLARPDEILVGQETYRQAFGFFDFDAKPPMAIRGKSRPIPVYAVKGEKSRPMPGTRKLNLYADFIGRQAEMNHLLAAIAELENGRGAVISIVGEAGTGKSRLIQEFERVLDGRQINWITGYAFAHTQPVPYFPLVGIVRRWMALEGTASAEEISAGIAKRAGALLGPNADEIPIIQGLIGQDVKATEDMSPDEWRKRLKSAMLNLLTAIAGQRQTVFCMEDIHWGDAASFKLLKDIIFNFDQPALVICTTRPHASLFTTHEQELLGDMYSEIHLKDLSPAETEAMLASMLDTRSLPEDLLRLVRRRAEGNPFFLEEILNALVDANALTFENGSWQMNRAFKETDVPSTIHGVIASRMDQLGKTDKRILQEAAVIGRAFLYDILKRISIYGDAVDDSLYRLERAGLIKPRSLHPEMEFVFKHALIQEVSYRSLLRRERQRVHERIGRTIEEVYQDRLSEFDETLAIHFQKSVATDKAADYLIRSGAKALRRCALDESDQYFKTAKSMLEQEHLATPATKKRLLDVVNQWAFVFYYKGLNRQLLELLEHQQSMLGDLNDPVREGFHWAWHGCALWHRHRFRDAYESLIRARTLGEKADNPGLIAYASTWLSWPCTELGRFDEALENAGTAETLFTEDRVQDAYIYFNGLFAKAYAWWHIGDAERVKRIGNRLIKFGRQSGNVRSMVSGHCCLGWRDLTIGDVDGAVASFDTAVQMSADPWYSQFPKLALCYGAISGGKLDTALPLLDQLIRFSDANGAEFVGDPARFFKGLVSILNGEVAAGLGTMESLLDKWLTDDCRLRCLTCGFVMGNVYSRLYQGAIQTGGASGSASLQALAENAIRWFTACTTTAEAMGARVIQGQARLAWGQLLAVLKRPAEARRQLRQSVAIFDQNGARLHLERAGEALRALGG